MNARSEVRQQETNNRQVRELEQHVLAAAGKDFFDRLKDFGACERCQSHEIRVFTKVAAEDGGIFVAFSCGRCGLQRG